MYHPVIYEFSRHLLHEKYGDNWKRAYMAKEFITWTPSRIQKSFSFGNGSYDDMLRYMECNRGNSIFISAATWNRV